MSEQDKRCGTCKCYLPFVAVKHSDVAIGVSDTGECAIDGDVMADHDTCPCWEAKE